MADPTGFLKHGRLGQSRRPVGERLHDWREVYIPLDATALRTQAARCMDCGIPFCHQGCPLGNIIPDWNDLVYHGRWKEAIDRLHSTNNFPEFTGRLCPAPCEAACVLGINQDPVTIKTIEQQIIDHAFDEGWVAPTYPTRRTEFTVAVVGSGPAGLAAAQQLNRAGHRVTVFERDNRIGGLLRYGIPDFKLEKSVLDRRLDILREEGIEFRPGVNVGADVSPERLRAEYDAVLIATGSTIPWDINLPGRELNGVHFAMDYLTQQNRLNGGELVTAAPISAKGKRVIIIGGGDTGADCLGTAHRQGAESVLQIEIMPRPGESRPSETPWPNWPLVLRSYAAHEEGGTRDWAIQTKSFSGADGKVTALNAVRVALGEPGDNGRRTLSEIPGTEFEIPCDLVLLAIGFRHPAHVGLLDGLKLQYDSRGNVQADAESYLTSVPNVWAAGDARRGQSLIVWAIAEGREAARQIDNKLTGHSQLTLAGADQPASVHN